MKKGIIMEISGDYITLLTPEGEFLKARQENQGYKIGEEIYFFPLTEKKMISARATAPFCSWKWKIISSAVVALLLLSFIPYYMQQQVYAYMSIDINPSLELGVNRKFKVVNVKAYNHGAEILLEGFKDWKGEPVGEVATRILEASEKQGYLQKQREVFITTVFQKETKQYKKQLSQSIESVKAKWEQQHYTIETANSTPAERELAEKQGITTGMMLRKKLKQQKKYAEKLELSKKVKGKQVPDSSDKEGEIGKKAGKQSGQPAAPLKREEKNESSSVEEEKAIKRRPVINNKETKQSDRGKVKEIKVPDHSKPAKEALTPLVPRAKSAEREAKNSIDRLQDINQKVLPKPGLLEHGKQQEKGKNSGS